MPRDPLTEMLTKNGIRAVTRARGGGLSVRFGSDIVKNLSDGQFPVEVYRCMKMGDGRLIEEHRRTVRLSHRLRLATSDAGRGWRHGAEEQWVRCAPPRTARRPDEARVREAAPVEEASAA